MYIYNINMYRMEKVLICKCSTFVYHCYQIEQMAQTCYQIGSIVPLKVYCKQML